MALQKLYDALKDGGEMKIVILVSCEWNKSYRFMTNMLLQG